MTNYVVRPNNIKEWTKICEAFAKKLNAKLVFVNDTSCGLEMSDGKMWHCSVEEMMMYLQAE